MLIELKTDPAPASKPTTDAPPVAVVNTAVAVAATPETLVDGVLPVSQPAAPVEQASAASETAVQG